MSQCLPRKRGGCFSLHGDTVQQYSEEVWLPLSRSTDSVLPRSRTHDLGARIIKASLSRRVGYETRSFSMASNVTQKGTLSHVCLAVSMERGGKTAYFPPTLTIFIGRKDARILTCVKSKRKRPTLRSCL